MLVVYIKVRFSITIQKQILRNWFLRVNKKRLLSLQPFSICLQINGFNDFYIQEIVTKYEYALYLLHEPYSQVFCILL